MVGCGYEWAGLAHHVGTCIMAAVDHCVGRSFDGFLDVEAFLESLKKQSHPLRVFNSQTSTNYNKKHNGDGVVDEEKFKYTYYSVRCVHFGKPRHRGKGIRPNQRTFPMECLAKVIVLRQVCVCQYCIIVSQAALFFLDF